ICNVAEILIDKDSTETFKKIKVTLYSKGPLLSVKSAAAKLEDIE
ncbi:3863_t:CDS:2, partial [Funneliformis caledonium]